MGVEYTCDICGEFLNEKEFTNNSYTIDKPASSMNIVDFEPHKRLDFCDYCYRKIEERGILEVIKDGLLRAPSDKTNIVKYSSFNYLCPNCKKESIFLTEFNLEKETKINFSCPHCGNFLSSVEYEEIFEEGKISTK